MGWGGASSGDLRLEAIREGKGKGNWKGEKWMKRQRRFCFLFSLHSLVRNRLRLKYLFFLSFFYIFLPEKRESGSLSQLKSFYYSNNILKWLKASNTNFEKRKKWVFISSQ